MGSQRQNLPKITSFIDLVDNIDFKVEIQNQEYIVLIKKQTDKQFSTLYLYDFNGVFWLKKIDLQYLQQLKKQLHINTTMETFIKCLVKSIKQHSEIKLEQQTTNLTIKLQIGQGLTMNCIITFSTKLFSKDQKGYKMILKLFLRQLYESNLSQQKCLKDQIRQLKKKKQDEEKQYKEKDSKYIQEVLNINEEKKDPIKIMKNRDLLNPNKVKRKQPGIKYNAINL